MKMVAVHPGVHEKLMPLAARAEQRRTQDFTVLNGAQLIQIPHQNVKPCFLQ